MKRVLSIVLAALMIAVMFPVAVGAQSQALNGSGWDPRKRSERQKDGPRKRR